jgi:hypothetical protein
VEVDTAAKYWRVMALRRCSDAISPRMRFSLRGRVTGRLLSSVSKASRICGTYSDSAFDVTINSEVLEQIKEYSLEGKAIKELKTSDPARGDRNGRHTQ